MSAQIVQALLARADQLDTEALAVVPDGTVRRPEESPEHMRWLAGELRAIARLAQAMPS